MCCPKAAAANEIKLNFELICLSSLQKANVTPQRARPSPFPDARPLTLHAKVKQLIWLSIDINLARGASSTMGNQGLKQRCLYNALLLLLLCCCAAFGCKNFMHETYFWCLPNRRRRRAAKEEGGGQACTAADTSKNVKQLSRQERQRESDQQNTLHFIYIISFFLYFFTTRWIYFCACVCMRVFILEIFIGYGKYKLINLPHNYGHTTNNNNNNPCLLSGELYFSIYFVAARAPKMRRYIFRIGRAHVFEISKLFDVFSEMWKNEKKTRQIREEKKEIRPAAVIIDTNRMLFQWRRTENSIEDALQCLTTVYEPQLQFKMSKKLMKFVQWLLSFSTNIFCSGCACVSVFGYVCWVARVCLEGFGRKIESISHAREP